jgi:beta-galactosidase/beta-glucuronidase
MLAASWSLASTAPGALRKPAQLDGADLQWLAARVPGTVAEVTGGGALDDFDWWYRGTFDGSGETVLHFGGLATLAQVWLNGELILQSENMFVEHHVDVGALLRPHNELVLCFRSLTAALAQRRPRPRWKTRLVNHQQLRWFRTTLLGRMPGWSPAIPAVGPWRPIWSAVAAATAVHDGSRSSRREGEALVASAPTVAHAASESEAAASWTGRWLRPPHSGPYFQRGVCWTVENFVTLRATEAEYRRVLTRLRDAGATMIRVGGTMVYEDDVFYTLCDELGLQVWQDFMFANMDYPVDDPQWLESVTTEVTQQLQRLSRHPSVVVYCGNSEVEQQAAMLGAPRELWRNRLFGEVLPELCARWHPGAAYVPSTPSGEGLPFQTDSGVTHYYGVGAYRRRVTDVRHADVRFASECLGFANVPEREMVDAIFDGGAPATHEPRWKQGVPRDSGSGYDFEDVREHYVRELFGVDPIALRSTDTPRYLDLGRVATGEMMAQVYSEWRRPGSNCSGALVWFHKDLEPGAGWGIVDSRGVPKACFYYLRRVWQTRTVIVTDEGLNGVHAHVLNESDEALRGSLEVMLLRDGNVVVAQASTPCDVAPWSSATFPAEEVLGAFHDTAYAYRFGPPAHDVLIATFFREDGSVLAEAFHFPRPIEPRPVAANLRAERGLGEVTLESDTFLYAVHFDVRGFEPEDNYFHLVPGRPKRVAFTGDAPKFAGFVEALNLRDAVRIAVPS